MVKELNPMWNIWNETGKKFIGGDKSRSRNTEKFKNIWEDAMKNIQII